MRNISVSLSPSFILLGQLYHRADVSVRCPTITVYIDITTGAVVGKGWGVEGGEWSKRGCEKRRCRVGIASCLILLYVRLARLGIVNVLTCLVAQLACGRSRLFGCYAKECTCAVGTHGILERGASRIGLDGPRIHATRIVRCCIRS